MTILIFIVAISSVSFFFYVDNRSEQLAEYYLRVLSVASDNVEDAIERLLLNVENAVQLDSVEQWSTIKKRLELIPVLGEYKRIGFNKDDSVTVKRTRVQYKNGSLILSLKVQQIMNQDVQQDSLLATNVDLHKLLEGTVSKRYITLMLISMENYLP